MPSPLTEKLQDLPEAVASGLTSFVASAEDIFKANLKSVVLYGSGAEGRLRPASDVNLILVLSSFDAAQADRIREPFAAARAAIQLTAMFLLEDELPRAVVSFGQKFADILRRHRVLYGADPFEGSKVPRAAAIFRLKQVLLNLTLRLREAYVERGSTPERIAELIADAAGPLRSCASTLLELEGKPPLPPKEALAAIVADFQDSGWEEVLGHISEARARQELPAAIADQTLFRLIQLPERIGLRAASLPPTSLPVTSLE
jgi:predicted nucleotidyltransferase